MTAIEGDFFAREADAMVSHANSFGTMTAGSTPQFAPLLDGEAQEIMPAGSRRSRSRK